MSQTKNQAGISIVIRAFLPTGVTIDDQIKSLNIVKNAHETQDYSELLSAADILDIKVEQKNRRVPNDDEPKPPEGESE